MLAVTWQSSRHAQNQRGRVHLQSSASEADTNNTKCKVTTRFAEQHHVTLAVLTQPSVEGGRERDKGGDFRCRCMK